MKRWLFWIYYLNPLSYGYEAIFANEFSRINVGSHVWLQNSADSQLTCDSAYTIPRNIPAAGITGYP